MAADPRDPRPDAAADPDGDGALADGDGEKTGAEVSDNIIAFDAGWRGRLHHGLRKLRQGDDRGAAAAFEQALAAAPDEPEVLLAVGRARMRQERYEEAALAFRRALQQQPTSATAAAGLARVLGLHLGQSEEAYAVIHRFLRRCPDAAPLHVVRGELLLSDGAITDARAAFGIALDQDVTDTAARLGLARSFNAEGILLGEQGDSERAVFCFKRAADLDPQWSGPCINLGVVLGRLGRLERALQAYGEALDRDPANPVAYFNLATTHQDLGDHDAAVARFEELLDLCPDYPEARTALATALAERGDLDRAIALLLEAIEIDSRSVSAWTSLGLAYVCSGNPERGEQCLLQALQIDRDYFNAYYNLAALYVAEERLDEAEAMLRQASARQPELTARLLRSDRQFETVRGMPRFVESFGASEAPPRDSGS